jgi:hypothetical protein
MADQKISALNELTTWATDDEIAIVDTDIVETKRMTAENVRINTMLGIQRFERSTETIDAAGAITITTSNVVIDTFGGAAADNLDNINGGTVDGELVIIRAVAGAARTPTLRDSVGNLRLAGNFSLDDTQDTIMLLWSHSESFWVEISRSNNA